MKRNLLWAITLMFLANALPAQVFTGINWINWTNEPNYEGITGYAENPYDEKRKTYVAILWDEFPYLESNEIFDTIWDALGEPEYVDRPTWITAGDIFDLHEEGTFGSMWKAVHDGTNLYVLLKYFDTNNQVEPDLKSFEIMAQPTDIIRHEPTFQEGVNTDDMALKNMAYSRFVELGGGKAVFKDGYVIEYHATIGLQGQWGTNLTGLESFIDETHYWDETNNIIRAMLIMPFDGALSYPADPYNADGERIAVTPGSTIAFDVKSNGTVDYENNIRSEYFWSADNNNGYGSNYYSGHLQLSAGEFYSLGLSAEPVEGGTVTGQGEYTQGMHVTVNAIPNPDWIFVKWTRDSQTESLQPQHSFYMPGNNLELTAVFTDKIPTFAWAPNIINETLLSGDQLQIPLNLSNTGDDGSSLEVYSIFVSTTFQNNQWDWIQLDTLPVSIEAGGNVQLMVDIDMTGVHSGIYEAMIVMETNDPVNPTVQIPVTISVQGIPGFSLSAAELDFGYLGYQAERTLKLNISNPGTENLIIENITSELPPFTPDVSSLEISPDETGYISITFPATEAGVFQSDLSFTTNAEGFENVTIPMLAEVGELFVSIIVIDSDENPIEGALVRVADNAGWFTTAQTDASGIAEFTNLYMGTFSYLVEKDEMETAAGNVDVNENATSFSVTLYAEPQMVFTAVNWINWEQEPNYPEITGYNENPYDDKRKYYTAYKLELDSILTFNTETFEQVWEMAGVAEEINQLVGGFDVFDFSSENKTGAQWKAIHDGSNLYVMLKYRDDNYQIINHTKSYEIMAQPRNILRHEPTYQFGLAGNDLDKQNMAYARYAELGGGKAYFADGNVNEYMANIGTYGYWGTNEQGFQGLSESTHYWEENDSVINAVLVMSFDQTLSYPLDPLGFNSPLVPLTEGKTISFDIMANGQPYDHTYSKYAWSGDNLNVYASNYYSGHMYISENTLADISFTLEATSFPAEGGTVDGEGEYDYGTEVSLMATPAEGWRFKGWFSGDDLVSTDNPYVFNIYSNKVLTARFFNQWPVIVVDPVEINENLDSGIMMEKELVISNTGNLSLNYSLSNYQVHKAQYIQTDYAHGRSDEPIPAKGEKDTRTGIPLQKGSGGPDLYGYAWIDSDEIIGPAYIWNDIKETGTLLQYLSLCDDCAETVPLSFSFPFYGEQTNSISVNSNGYIQAGEPETWYANFLLPDPWGPKNIIAGFWTDLCPGCTYNENPEQGIYFQDFGNHAVFQFNEVRLYSALQNVTFQLVIESSGIIRLYYKDVPEWNFYTIGMQDAEGNSGFSISHNNNYLKDEHAIIISTLPQWLSFHPETGTVPAGESDTILIGINTQNLVSGLYESMLVINSDDPDNNTLEIPVNITVTGFPQIELSAQDVDFGINAPSRPKTIPLLIANPGTANLEITEIAISGGFFTTSSGSELVVPPFQQRFINTTFLAGEEGDYTGTIQFNTNVEGQESFTVPLSASVLKLDATFTVVDEQDDPLESASISITQNGAEIATGFTNAEGIFVAENLPVDSLQYTITKNHYRTKQGTLFLVDESVEIPVQMMDQYIRFASPLPGSDFEVGVDQSIPVRIDIRGFDNINYELRIGNNEFSSSIATGAVAFDNEHTIETDYEIHPLLLSGTYNFFLYFNASPPFIAGTVFSEPFNVTNNTEAIEVVEPYESYDWYFNNYHFIRWNSNNVDLVNIYYSTDEGVNWRLIADSVDSYTGNSSFGQNNYPWLVDVEIDGVNPNCKIRVESVTNAGVFDDSDLFTLVGPPVVIHRPTAETEIIIGQKLFVNFFLAQHSIVDIDVVFNNGNTYDILYGSHKEPGNHEIEYFATPMFQNTGSARIRIYHRNTGTTYFSDTFRIYQIGEVKGVHFHLDMTDAMISEDVPFNWQEHDLYVSGTFKDQWLMPGLDNTYRFDLDFSNEHRLVIFSTNDTIRYRYFVVPKGGLPTWEFGEGDTTSVRTALLNENYNNIYESWINPLWFNLTLEPNIEDAGSVSGSGSYLNGQDVVIEATPAENYRFVNWSTPSKEVMSTDAEYTFSMPANHIHMIANFESTVSTHDLITEAINIYPNPASNVLFIESGATIINMRLTDMAGKVVISLKDVHSTDYQINTEHLETGIYILKIEGEHISATRMVEIIR